jgi:energy-coupling factor transporter ATP-binding protein EcfA2
LKENSLITEVAFHRETIHQHKSFGYIAGLLEKNEKKKPSQFPERVLFKPGVNVIVGSNGSGKSTILKALRMYTLTEKMFYSRIPDSYFWMQLENILSPGIDVYGDYTRVVFNFREASVISQGDNWLDGEDNILQTMHESRSSSGQSILRTFNMMLDYMFGESRLFKDQLMFPVGKLRTKANEWKGDPDDNRYARLLDYYTEHTVSCPSRFTMLLDEPDKGLDIFNIINTIDIYSTERSDTQVIVCLHNPAVIYRLATQKDPPNFIELTFGYVGDVIDFIESGISTNRPVYKRGSKYAPDFLNEGTKGSKPIY